MTKPLLFIAFHFPPCFGSSGLQRTLSFVRHFANTEQWQPLVLSASANAYAQKSNGQLGDIPSGAVVHRAFALDSARHLAIAGRYLNASARPDRWTTWQIGAIPAGLRMIRKYRPVAIWSTYPLATAHAIAATLARITGIPWICDFRDPMVEYDSVTKTWFPSDQKLKQSRLRIERRCVRHASKFVFCTETAKDIFIERYPQLDRDRCHVIPNGYDEEIFLDIDSHSSTKTTNSEAPTKLLHSGTLYPGEDRSPIPFFRALHQLKSSGDLCGDRLKVMLRATGFDTTYLPAIKELGLEDIVQLLPAIDYRDSIREMLMVDSLLLFQGRTSNPAIPAKLYEYLRAGRPIFALVHEHGETANLLRNLGTGTPVPLDDERAIADNLRSFLDDLKKGGDAGLSRDTLKSLSRTSRALELESLIDETIQNALN